ncbi:unnamed protein product [Danaus chrysippus]|uniref:(African queen) hypothetical protein n=1 Tax=Danaus chrysippus TaxID=151541 RepID=A0A8J2QMC7_9NEOP|nr:unnamed protein product [Danaus chrysippus]
MAAVSVARSLEPVVSGERGSLYRAYGVPSDSKLVLYDTHPPQGPCFLIRPGQACSQSRAGGEPPSGGVGSSVCFYFLDRRVITVGHEILSAAHRVCRLQPVVIVLSAPRYINMPGGRGRGRGPGGSGSSLCFDRSVPARGDHNGSFEGRFFIVSAAQVLHCLSSAAEMGFNCS